MEVDMNLMQEVNRQVAILSENTAEVFPESGLREKLEYSIKSNTPLRVKMGIDPTSPDVHLGHMVVYKKMRQFQDLGHKAVLIIGDYTAGIGDPTGRDSERPPLSPGEIKSNSETYTNQIFKIVDPEKTEVHFHSSWFDKVSLQDILSTASAFSVAHMLTHETFRRRLEKGKKLSLHEMIYPLLQAWDSIETRADIELGGMDQKFNILCGRDLQKANNMKPQIVLLMPLLMGTDGRKMSKSLQNHIPVLSTASEKFGKVMSISDDLILNFFTYSTALSKEGILQIESRLVKENPRDIKIELAKEIISIYHTYEEAENCERDFKKQFTRKEIPENIPNTVLLENGKKLINLLKETGIIDSISEGKRLINQGGLSIDGNKIRNPDLILELRSNTSIIVKAGKRRYLKICKI
jgi:tyrosyl-tRNA synthetase